jgi:hypothetical protein
LVDAVGGPSRKVATIPPRLTMLLNKRCHTQCVSPLGARPVPAVTEVIHQGSSATPSFWVATQTAIDSTCQSLERTLQSPRQLLSLRLQRTKQHFQIKNMDRRSQYSDKTVPGTVPWGLGSNPHYHARRARRAALRGLTPCTDGGKGDMDQSIATRRTRRKSYYARPTQR